MVTNSARTLCSAAGKFDGRIARQIREHSKMKIIDMKVAVIGQNPVVRIITDEGIDGIGAAEAPKHYLKPHIIFYKDSIMGMDPTDVERVMLEIRSFAAFKPWGAAVSAIEVALWDIAGKAVGQPIYKLLGGKIRDRVRVYNGSIAVEIDGHEPEDYAAKMRKVKALPQGFSIVKQGIAFHSNMPAEFTDYHYGDVHPANWRRNSGKLTERGLNYTIECVQAMKEGLGDGVGLALDCGPGMTPVDTLKLAQAFEPLNLMWMEDTMTGDYTPYVDPERFLQVTPYTNTPIHTGEQIYLRNNFKDLIEQHAVDVVGPDPLDVGGIAELKWVAELADLHGIMMAPHGVADGLIGLAALVQVSATLPENYIGFELPSGKPEWWNDIIVGLPDPIVKNGFIDVWDTPGLGIHFDVEATRQYLRPEDADFFD